LIAKGRLPDVQFTASFPESDDGILSREEFERFIEEGTPATIEGRFLQDLRFSDWWMKWYGGFQLENVQLKFSPNASEETQTVKLLFVDFTEKSTIGPTIEFKSLSGGTKLVTYSNQHQTAPLQFKLALSTEDENLPVSTGKQSAKITYRIVSLGSDVEETKRLLSFLDALSTGGTLQFLSPSDGTSFLSMTIPAQPNAAVPGDFLALVDELCTIQRATSHIIRVPEEGFTENDVRVIRKLTTIINHGYKRIASGSTKAPFKIELKKDALEIVSEVHCQGKAIHFTLLEPGGYVDLLGTKVRVGPMTRHITGKCEMTPQELNTAIVELDAEDALTLTFPNVEVIDVFPRWFKREASRLGKLLVESYGAETAYLYGSLAWSEIHKPETDIDLAVKGLPPELFYVAASSLERTSNFPIDLVDITTVPTFLRKRILEEGKILYERETTLATSG
jgi:predicted nucleotidyltransferase